MNQPTKSPIVRRFTQADFFVVSYPGFDGLGRAAHTDADP